MRVPFEEMKSEFERVLRAQGFPPEKAATIGRIFAENSRDGVASHGLNRFPGFVQFITDGYIDIHAEPERVAAFGAWEQWDGQLGPGPLNALRATDRALELARQHGVGCVGLRNTNHWMRGGAFGWRAADAGFGLISWTNTKPNMPPWGGRSLHVGNNPLVLAVPRADGPVVLDMAMSQYSMGRLEIAAAAGEELDVPAGFDAAGNLTGDAAAVLASGRALPAGYWKGSGLALLIDLLGALLAGGQSTFDIGQQETEYAVCQIFIAFDLQQAGSAQAMAALVERSIDDLHRAIPDEAGQPPLYPGERALRTRQDSLANGVLVDPEIWARVQAM